MSVSLWRWNKSCDGQECIGDCDRCSIGLENQDVTNMVARRKAKHYLSAVHYARLDVKRLTEQIDALRESAGGLRAITYDGDKVQTSPENRLEETLARIDELEREFAEDLKDLYELIKRVENEIGQMENKTHAEILKRRYIDEDKRDGHLGRPSFEKIAYDMSLAYSYVRQLHSAALVEFFNEIMQVRTQ